MSAARTYDLAGRVIGAAMRVHRELGSGFLEQVYQNALAIELGEEEMRFEAEKKLAVHYRNQVVGTYAADFVVEDQLILEKFCWKIFFGQ